MNAAPLREPVAIELQDATGATNLPEQAEWCRWVTVTHGLADAGPSSPGRITVRLVGREEGQTLNKTFRNQPGATNVLAFPGPGADEVLPLDDSAQGDPELGDLIICLPVVYREAQDQGKAPVAHIAHMVVHGTLHLLGFDHDDDAAAQRMESLETEIMHRLGFADPYEAG